MKLARAPLALLLGAAFAGSCSSAPPKAAGIMLVVSGPDVYAGDDFDALQITVGDKTTTRTNLKDIALPTSIGIDGLPKGAVKVEVRALKNGVVRLAAAAKTTAPAERPVVLSLALHAACRDRCVQVGANDPLTAYCDAATKACVPEAKFDVPLAKLAPYDAKADPTAGLASIECGSGTVQGDQACNGADLGGVGCDALLGEASAGDARCVACRSVTSGTCSNANGFAAGAPWPAGGRGPLRQGRGAFAGPRAAASTIKPVNADSVGAPFSTPVVGADGTVWLTTSFYAPPQAPKNANGAGAVISIVGDAMNVYQPDPWVDCRLDSVTEVGGSRACRWSQPILADDGALWAMTNTGEGFRFTAPGAKPERTVSVLDTLKASCNNQTYCNISQLGAVVRQDKGETWAYVPTGGGLMVYRGANVASLAVQNTVQQCPSWGNHVPAIGRDGTLYLSLQWVFGQKDQHLAVCAVDPNGAFKWRSPDAKGQTTAPVIGPDDTMYFGSADQRLYALDLHDHAAFKWTFATGGPTTAPAIGEDGTIYFGSGDEYLYALEPNGGVKWTLRVSGAIAAAPMIDATGTIFFGTRTGFFYAVNPNGTVLFRTFTGSPVSEQAALDAEGTVWFGTEDGFVFAIRAQ